MFFKQITVPGLGCNSYIIGCPGAKKAVVVDPKRDIQDYLDITREEGMNITHIIETHIHADHVSGNQELKALTGADIYYSEHASVEFPHQKLKEGETIEFGTVKIDVLYTPGHTPNSLSLLLADKTRSDDPWMILTGDLLFVGSIGRPDLAGEEAMDEQIQNLYDSLYNKFNKLPDHLEVYPAHGQGSLCGKGLSAKPSSTLGYERKTQPVLKLSTFGEFYEKNAIDPPERPKSFSYIINTNIKGAPLLKDSSMEKALTPERFDEFKEKGATVIDIRDAAAFSGFHISGSLNIGFGNQVANWTGMVVDPNDNLLLVANNRQQYYQMVTELHRIGYDNILGYLSGGMSKWISKGKQIDSLSPISIHRLKNQLDEGNFGYILDVRTKEERKAGYIPESRHIPMTEILKNGLDMPLAKEIILYCGSGYRSNIIASQLKKDGFTHIHSLPGGIIAWKNAGFPIEKDKTSI